MTMRVFSLTLLVLTIAVLVSCKKDPEPPEEIPVPGAPSLTVSINGAENLTALNSDIGDTISISVSASAPAGIDAFTASYTLDETQTDIDTYSSDSLLTAYNMPVFTYLITTDVVEKTLTFDFHLADTLGITDDFTFVLTVNESPLATRLADTLSPYNGLNFGNLFDAVEGNYFFPLNVKTNTTKQGKVDFIFAHDLIEKWMIMSPDHVDTDTIWNHNVSFNWPFTVINNTRFINQDTAVVRFDEISTAAELSDLFEGSQSSLLSKLFVGQLISFRLGDSRNGKVGILRITSIKGNSRTPYEIVFDVKIQS